MALHGCSLNEQCLSESVDRMSIPIIFNQIMSSTSRVINCIAISCANKTIWTLLCVGDIFITVSLHEGLHTGPPSDRNYPFEAVILCGLIIPCGGNQLTRTRWQHYNSLPDTISLRYYSAV